jgi:uncharacterized protein (DUF2062 family)
MPNGQMEAMNHRKATLSDPEHARVAWARYRKLMKWMLGAAIAAVVASLVYLGSGGGPLPVHMVIATIAGVGFSVLLAAALMGLVFLSSGSGHDEDAADSSGDRK